MMRGSLSAPLFGACLLVASVHGAPCDCKAQWSWAGDTFANCQYTPSNFNFATCEVEGPACDTASNYIDPATGTKKTHKVCIVGTDPINMDYTTDCVCDTTWSWSTDAACQDVSGCPVTACVAPPFFLAKSWCKVKNAPCKTATENTAGPSYSICTPEEIVGACDCMDEWEHNGASYTGCSTTPENPGVPWCKIHASCKTGMKAYDNTWTEYYWKACKFCDIDDDDDSGGRRISVIIVIVCCLFLLIIGCTCFMYAMCAPVCDAWMTPPKFGNIGGDVELEHDSYQAYPVGGASSPNIVRC